MEKYKAPNKSGKFDDPPDRSVMTKAQNSLFHYFNQGESFWPISEWPNWAQNTALLEHKPFRPRYNLFYFYTANGVSPVVAEKWVRAKSHFGKDFQYDEYDESATRDLKGLVDKAYKGTLFQNPKKMMDMTVGSTRRKPPGPPPRPAPVRTKRRDRPRGPAEFIKLLTELKQSRLNFRANLAQRVRRVPPDDLPDFMQGDEHELQKHAREYQRTVDRAQVYHDISPDDVRLYSQLVNSLLSPAVEGEPMQGVETPPEPRVPSPEPLRIPTPPPQPDFPPLRRVPPVPNSYTQFSQIEADRPGKSDLSGHPYSGRRRGGFNPVPLEDPSQLTKRKPAASPERPAKAQRSNLQVPTPRFDPTIYGQSTDALPRFKPDRFQEPLPPSGQVKRGSATGASGPKRQRRVTPLDNVADLVYAADRLEEDEPLPLEQPQEWEATPPFDEDDFFG